MAIIHWISWICLVGLVLPVAWILWIKNRSAVNTWVRPVQHSKRWLLCTRLDKSSTGEDIQRTLRNVVTESKNAGWNASCAYKKRDPASGEWIVGLISTARPLDTQVPAPFEFTEISPSQTVRVSCPANEENTNIKADLKHWAEQNGTRYDAAAVSLSAQSFQCWEWNISNTSETSDPSFLARFAEKIFEMRDIALYPTIITIIALFLCGTGNFWLFGIGVFTIILMSGAHKFVFMYQREDLTQEEHLQNY